MQSYTKAASRTNSLRKINSKAKQTRLLPFILGVAFLATPIAAKETNTTCKYADTIVELSRISAEARPEQRYNLSQSYGTMAAYLWAQYGNLSVADSLAQFEASAAIRLDNAAELLLAFQVFHADSATESELIRTAIEAIDAGASDIFRGMQLSLLRAVLLKSGGAPLFEILNSDEELFQKFLANSGRGHFGSLLSDQSEQVRLDLAERFEQASLYANAIDLLLSLPNLDPALQFIKRHRNEEWLETALQDGSGYFYQGQVHAIMNGNEEEFLARIVPADREVQDEVTNIILGLRHTRYSQILFELINYTDDWAFSASAGEIIHESVQNGDIDPLVQPFAPLTLMYREYIDYTFDPYATESFFAFFPDSGYWRFDSNHDFLQFFTAAQAFEPFMLDQLDIVQKPWQLPDSFNWQSWQTAAEAVRSRDTSSIEQGTRYVPKITAELMFRAKNFRMLSDLLLGLNDRTLAYELAEQFAIRLDLRCERYLDLEFSTLSFGAPLFRFDR